jgi:hypothetical protein
MTRDRLERQGPFASGRSRRLVPIVLKGLLVVSLLMAPASGVSARSLGPLPAARDRLSTGTTLAVVRAGGASLVDDAGKLLLDLPMGAAVKVSGRTSGNDWFYGSTKDGTTGWISAANVLIFAVSNAMMPSAADRQPWVLAGLYVAGVIVIAWVVGLFGYLSDAVWDNVLGALQVLTLAFLFTVLVNVVIGSVLWVVASIMIRIARAQQE